MKIIICTIFYAMLFTGVINASDPQRKLGSGPRLAIAHCPALSVKILSDLSRQTTPIFIFDGIEWRFYLFDETDDIVFFPEVIKEDTQITNITQTSQAPKEKKMGTLTLVHEDKTKELLERSNYKCTYGLETTTTGTPTVKKSFTITATTSLEKKMPVPPGL